MLYRFNHLKSVYSLRISRCHEKLVSSYTCNIHVSASIKNGIGIFTFEKRENLSLNNKKFQHPADIMMCRLGDSLYPFTFRVSESGCVKGLDNVKNIQDRWIAQSKKLLKEMKYAPVVERYINASWLNIKDENKLMMAILRDSFVKLYFTAHGNTINFTAYNFPELGFCRNFELHADIKNKNYTCLSTIDEQSILSYERSAYGDMLNLVGKFVLSNEKGIHQLNVEIKNNITKREIR